MLVELIIGGKEAGPNELRMCKAPTFSALSRTLRHSCLKRGYSYPPPRNREVAPLQEAERLQGTLSALPSSLVIDIKCVGLL